MTMYSSTSLQKTSQVDSNKAAAEALPLPDPAGQLWAVISSYLTVALLSLGLMSVSTPSALAGEHQGHVPDGDIVKTAVEAGQFETLATALQAAGLVDVLKGEGPFTVFAPTDAAFAKLPEGTVESLLQPENVDQLRAVLTYHVVPGRLDHTAVAEATALSTVQGSEIQVRSMGGAVYVDDARVVTVDVHATNGVIHVIDAVILPPEAQ